MHRFPDTARSSGACSMRNSTGWSARPRGRPRWRRTTSGSPVEA
jgi:hypothetical protein